MKHFLFVLTVLLLVAVLATFGLSATKAKRVTNSSYLDVDRSILAQFKQNRERLTPEIKKLLADDDPTPMANSPYSDLSARRALALPLKAKTIAPFAAPLNGSYNVGSGGAYATLSDAIDAVNANGVSGPVTLVLTDASYSEHPNVVGTIAGASATNTVTLTAKSGVNAVVNFTLFGAQPWGFIFANAHYFNINGTLNGGTLKFAIDETATAFPLHPREATIAFGGQTDHISIKNMTVTSAADNATWTSVKDARHGIIFLLTDLSTLVSDVTIDNCKFGRCLYGIVSTVPNDGDDGTIFNGGATGTTVGQCLSTFQRIHITNNQFGTVLTGEQPCVGAISIGGYSLVTLMAGYDIEVGGNKAIGDTPLGDLDYVNGSGSLIGTYTGLWESLYLGGLFGPLDIAVHGANNTHTPDSSTVHDNVDSLFNPLKSLTFGTSSAAGNLLFVLSVRGGNATVYNNVLGRAYSNDGGRQVYNGRWESCRLYHNSSWAQGPGFRFFAGRVRGGCTFKNNVFYVSNGVGSSRVTALRYDGGTGNNNVIARSGETGTRLIGNTFVNVNDLAEIQALGSDRTSSLQSPNLTSLADLHPSGTSSAEGLGLPIGGFSAKDFDGNVRSGSTPDAGAFEFSGTAHTGYTDAAVLSISNPTSAGTPAGLPATPKVLVENGSDDPQTISVEFFADSGVTHVYDQVVSTGSMPGRSTTTVTFPDWVPASNGPYTVKAVATLAGDALASNNSKTQAQPIIGTLTVPQFFDFESGTQEGWVGTGSWILDDDADDFGTGNLFDLGGPYGGTGFAWVTDDLSGAGTYAVQTNHQLLSPFFNTIGISNMYVNFFHAMRTEPNWDRSVFEYSLDTGKTWNVIGGLNDPNGINWYSTNPYENAAGDAGCFDNATAGSVKWPTEALAGTNVPAWTSNGNCHGNDLATGPDGYIFSQIKLPAAVIGHPKVRFRYAAFSDGSSTDFGWAIDNIRFDTVGNNLTGSFSGKVYGDGNADGSKQGYESGLSGKKVYITGGRTDSTTTDVNGDYTFSLLVAGAYTFSVGHSSGTSVTQPYGPNTYTQLFAPGDIYTGKDFGLFTGGIHGDPYQDNNGNGVKNAGEPGVAGWEIRAYNMADLGAFKQALATGDNATLNTLKVASSVSDGSGNYFLETKAGDYIIAEVLDPKWKNTQPGKVDTAQVFNPDDGSTASIDLFGYYTAVHVDSLAPGPAGGDFGNFKYGVLKVYSTLDVNGNGVVDGPDVLGLPLGAFMNFQVTKNGSPYTTLILGNTVSNGEIGGLDIGSYVITQTSYSAGFTGTLISGHATNVYTSGIRDTAHFMLFKNVSISGKKFNDMNGDGNATGDPGLAGWKIYRTGSPADTQVTDGSGNYSFANVGPGTYTVGEVNQAGWTNTAPSGGTYSVPVVVSGGNIINKNFGNFQNICVSGVKYRDRNNNGTRDAGEEGLSGWTIKLGASTTTTAGDGSYQFCNLAPGGPDTLREVGQAGYTQTEPVSPGYIIVTRTSGGNVTQNFGNFDQNDSTKYRTWTVGELAGTGEAKPVKTPKAGKPITAAPNSANMINDMLKNQAGTLQVGLAGQLNAASKEKAYLAPAKQSSVYETFNKKGVVHTGANRGFDFDNKAKAMLKKQKSLPATKKNDVTVAELLALKVNLLASQLGKTTPGLGSLAINRPGNPWNGQTVDNFAAAADGYMTNWEGTPFSTFDSITATAQMINGAFSTGSTTDTASNGGWTSPKLKWIATIPIINRPQLKHSNNAPKPPVLNEHPPVIPKVYGLAQNYPNPFNPTTSISFDLPEAAKVTLKVYNMLGQEITTLLNNESFDAGNQEVEFDASELPSGVYFYRINANSVDEDGNVLAKNVFSSVKKMMLVK